jgi:hypothetical protein
MTHCECGNKLPKHGRSNTCVECYDAWRKAIAEHAAFCAPLEDEYASKLPNDARGAFNLRGRAEDYL